MGSFREPQPFKHMSSAELVVDTKPVSLDDVHTIKMENGASELVWYELMPKGLAILVVCCFVFALVMLVGAFLFSNQSKSMDDIASPGVLLTIGVLFSIIGSLQTAAGYCCQRLGYQVEQVTGRRSMRQSPLKVVGLMLLIAGTIAAILNLGILGQSVTAPFAAMTLIFNGVLAVTVLHESVTRVDVLATILVLVGVCIAMLGVATANLDQQEFHLRDIERILFYSPLPGAYSIVVLSSLIGSFIYITRNGLEATNAGLCLFSIGAGMLSGFSSLCVKCVMEIVKSAAQHHSTDLGNPLTYLFALGIPACVLSQLKLMNMGLKHFGTLKYVPPYHAFIILSNFANGMVYFGESKGFGVIPALLFVFGCGVTIGGVLMLWAKK